MRWGAFPSDLQLDRMDCGPACLKIIARYFGKFYSLQYLRDQCGITREGVAMSDLSFGAEAIGMRSLALKCKLDELVHKIPLPCIAHLSGGHFVVVYKTNKKYIYLSDPARGLVYYSHKEFSGKWYKKGEKKGVIMAVEPQSDFHARQQEGETDRKKTLHNLLSYFTPYKKSFGTLLMVMMLVMVLQALLPFLSRAIIDIGIHTQDITFINITLVANIVILFSATLGNAIRDWILLHLTARINIALISDYLIKLMKLPVSFFENKMIGDILQRANDHERIRNFIMNNSISMLFSVLTFIIFGVTLMFFNRTVFLIFLAGSLLYITWVLSFLKIRKMMDWKYFELSAREQSHWVETITCVQDIKINNYERAKRWKWESIQARLYKVSVNMLSLTNTQNMGVQFIDSLKNIIITFYCAKAVIRGEITFGVMISVQFIIGMLNGPVLQFVQFMLAAQTARISFLRLNEIHKLEDEEENSGNNEISLPENKSITVDNVAFQYTKNAPFVLQGIRITIPAGKVTAIVGDSGSGKSTLLKLLLRLYKPSYGELLIGDLNVKNIGLRQWRDKCGAVLQEGKIFNDTILNNIVLDSEKIDYDRLKNAVVSANIAREIEQLPLGYKTRMGEQGRGLSGGQKQRILIARALYKNPDYLFFDEATNSLDSINEQKIVQALDKVFKGKTVVVVAHRLSTIRKADQIIVMKNGRVIECGTHEKLMLQKEHYYELVRSQMEMPVIIPPADLMN